MSKSSSAPHFATLALLSALCIFPINIYLPSLSNMATDFAVDYGTVALALATYAAVSACLQIIMGPLSDRYGRRPVVLSGLAIFIAATLGCIFAPDIKTFLFFRMMQAVIAPAYAVVLAVVRDTTSKQEAAGKIASLAMVWSLAPLLGPSLGGVLDDLFDWRASFWFLAILGMAVFALCWFDLRETNTTPSRTLSEQFKAYPDLLRSKRFWAYALCMAFSVGTFYAFLAGAPLAASSAFGLTAGTLGLFIGSITFGFMVGSYLAKTHAARFALTTTLVVGRLIACIGLAIGVALYALDIDHVLALFGPCMLVGLSNGLTMPSANTGAISVRPKLIGSAAGLASAISILGGAVVSSITGAVLTDENARIGLFLVMLSSAVAALIAALCARHLERRSSHIEGS
jgi:Bcr/CflA subfamily drug resistance transporter